MKHRNPHFFQAFYSNRQHGSSFYIFSKMSSNLFTTTLLVRVLWQQGIIIIWANRVQQDLSPLQRGWNSGSGLLHHCPSTKFQYVFLQIGCGEKAATYQVQLLLSSQLTLQISKTTKTTSLDQHLIKSHWLLVLICFLKAVQSRKSSIKIYATSEESLFSKHELIFTRRNSFPWAADVPAFACVSPFFQMERYL